MADSFSGGFGRGLAAGARRIGTTILGLPLARMRGEMMGAQMARHDAAAQLDRNRHAVYEDAKSRLAGGNLGLEERLLNEIYRATGGNVGNAQNAANAVQTIFGNTLGRLAMENPQAAGQLSQAVAVSEGKKLIDNIGNTGRGYNAYTGEGGTLEKALAVLYDGETASRIAENRAQAASAGASAARTRQAMKQEKVRPFNIVNPDGTTQTVNIASGKAVPIPDQHGNPIVPVPKSSGKSGVGGRPQMPEGTAAKEGTFTPSASDEEIRRRYLSGEITREEAVVLKYGR